MSASERTMLLSELQQAADERARLNEKVASLSAALERERITPVPVV